MNNLITWVNENREWLFSGIGITIISLIFTGAWRLFRKRKIEKNSKIVVEQINYGRKNIQVGVQNNYHVKENDDE